MNYNVNNENERIIIGEVGENLAESCTIDYSAWVEEYGEGNLRIRAIREGDVEPYPVANVDTADGLATWTYTAADAAVKGFGEVQVLYYVGDVLAKSRVWKTYTYRSLNTSSEEVPDPYADWLNAVERIGGQVEADAEAASASADSASASATLAAGSASEAAESALSATRSESSAQEYASAASSSADSAASSATAASRSATEASNYEYNSEQYMNEAKSAKFGAESARTGAENAKAAAQASATAAAQSAEQAEETAESIEESADLIQKLMDNQIKDTATGTIATYPDGADMPMVSLVADIDPIQDTSGGAPSPSHICPISGWDSVDVSVAGKDLFNVSMDSTQVDPTRKYTLHLKPNTQYTMSTDVPYTSPASVYFNGGSSGTNGVGLNRPKTFTSDANGMLTVDIRTRAVDQSINAYDALLNGVYWIQLEEGDTATTYEAYTETTHTTTLPQTVYGGTLDVVSGVLTVTHGFVTFNGTESWGWNSGNSLGYCTVPNCIITDATTQYNIYTKNNMFTDISWAWRNTVDGVVGVYYGGSYIFLKYSQFTSASDIQTFLANNNLQVCYPLQTPQTYQLTPTQIDSLLGSNNVWADSGDVTVEYIADTKLYIQKVIS